MSERNESVVCGGADSQSSIGDGSGGGSGGNMPANTSMARRRTKSKSTVHRTDGDQTASGGAAPVRINIDGHRPTGGRTKSKSASDGAAAVRNPLGSHEKAGRRTTSKIRAGDGAEGAVQTFSDSQHMVGRPTNSKKRAAKSGAGEVRLHDESQAPLGLADIIAEIAELHRRHYFMKRVSGDLVRAFKSKCRAAAVQRIKAEGGTLPKDGKFPKVTKHDEAVVAGIYPGLIAARTPIDAQWKAWEKRLAELAEQLPVYAWATSVRGIGAISLAQIIGETGDLSNYPSCRHVWKRMGMGLVGDKIQRRTTDKELAIAMGYAPRRRSLMFIIGDNLIRAGNEEYRAIYDARKAYEAERDPKMSKLHAHRRAKRVMEKRLLKELWRAWRRSIVMMTACPRLAAAEPLPMAAE